MGITMRALLGVKGVGDLISLCIQKVFKMICADHRVVPAVEINNELWVMSGCAPQPRCVLVVEDSPVFQQQLETALHLLGPVELELCDSGRAAREVLGRAGSALDLVLVDIGLPDMSGIDVIREVRGVNPTVPVLVISVIRTEATLLEAIQAGAKDFVVKPFDNDKLTETLVGAYRKTRKEPSHSHQRTDQPAPRGAVWSQGGIAGPARMDRTDGRAGRRKDPASRRTTALTV